MLAQNCIDFPYDYHLRHVRKKANEVKFAIEQLGYENIILDFAGLGRAFPDAMVPLISLVTHYRNECVSFAIVPPRQSSLRRTFESSNWCHLIDPMNHPASVDVRHGRLPARLFNTFDEQFTIVNEVIDTILRAIHFLNRDSLRALEWCINEITDNVLTHSFSSTGGVIQLTLKPNAKEIEFLVSDFGHGIPKTLREGLATNWSDTEALEESVKEGVTRGTGQGNGLFGSLQVAAESGGAFSVNSGYAFLSLSRDGKTKISADSLTWPGTSVDCSISYARPLILEKALRFANKTHVPLDTVDYLYSTENGVFIFDVCKEARSIGSRISGYELRKKIENLHRLNEHAIAIIDFNNIGVMSSSFADEFVAKLILGAGVSEFPKKFLLSNLSSTNYLITDRSVAQRTGTTLADIIQKTLEGKAG